MGNLATIKRRSISGNNEKSLYVICNSRGDVEELRNTDGTLYARYVYDSWGNTIKILGSDGKTAIDIENNTNNIAVQNPLRYRGYYWDSETGLYYLQSRYYDPVVGRFINADDRLSAQSGNTGYNLYCYGGNNPINTADPTGHAFMFLTAAIGAAAGAIAGGLITKSWKGALVGAAAGGLLGLGAGAAAAAMLAGSATASTAAVITGGTALINAVSAGGLGAGVTYIANNVSEALNKASPVVQSAASKMKEVADKGKVGEIAANIIKNNSHIDSLTGTAKYRIPDMLDHTAKILGEVKNYSGTISYTAQLRDFVLWSQLNGYQMYLYTNTTSFSGPLQQLIDDGVIQVLPIG